MFVYLSIVLLSLYILHVHTPLSIHLLVLNPVLCSHSTENSWGNNHILLTNVYGAKINKYLMTYLNIHQTCLSFLYAWWKKTLTQPCCQILLKNKQTSKQEHDRKESKSIKPSIHPSIVVRLSKIPMEHRFSPTKNSFCPSQIYIYYLFIFYFAEAENLGNSTAILRIWHLVRPALSIYLKYLSLRGCSRQSFMSQQETDNTAALRLPVKWFSLLINTKNNQPLSSSPLWSFNTPQTCDRLWTLRWDRALSPIYVSESLIPALWWRNIHFLQPSGPRKAQVLTEPPMTEFHFGHRWAKADSCRDVSRIPHTKTWLIDISLCMRLFLPSNGRL